MSAGVFAKELTRKTKDNPILAFVKVIARQAVLLFLCQSSLGLCRPNAGRISLRR